jgi:hypothetical protein
LGGTDKPPTNPLGNEPALTKPAEARNSTPG